MILGLVAIGFLAVILARTWDDVVWQVQLSGWRLGVAGVLLLAANGALARSWASLFGGEAARPQLVRGYFQALPAKYIPGGWAQPIGQVGLAGEAGVGLGHATVAYPVQVLCLVVAGAAMGSGLFLARGVPPVLRWFAGAGLASVVLLWRRWMEFTLGAIGKVFKRGSWGDLLPPQSSIWRSFGWTALGLGFMALSFAGLLTGVSAGGFPAPLAMSAFAFAWLAGFLAVPFPAGVGVREGVLIAALAGAAPAPVVISIALIHRALQMVSELVLALGSGLQRL
ncbi:MAG TPA: hypothetical protein ENH33_03990 [Actinobacteria bacterium]|nr:hypothetical protein [Actinomycetota bacterium]